MKQVNKSQIKTFGGYIKFDFKSQHSFGCAYLFSKSEIMLIVYTFVWHLSCSKLTDHSTNSFSHFLYQRTSHFNLVEAALQCWLLQHEIEYGNIYIKQHCKNSKHEHWTQFSIVILLPKLFWPTVRKIILVIEKIFWNSRLKAKNLQIFWDR